VALDLKCNSKTLLGEKKAILKYAFTLARRTDDSLSASYVFQSRSFLVSVIRLDREAFSKFSQNLSESVLTIFLNFCKEELLFI